MVTRKSIFFFLFSFFIFQSAFAASEIRDNGLSVLGDEVEDLLGNPEFSREVENDGAMNSPTDSLVDKMNITSESSAVSGSIGDGHVEDLKPSNEFKDIGYNVPGTFEGKENYIEIDKDQYTRKLKDQSTSALNLIYIVDNFDYQSPNNIINRTITQGYKHAQSGFLLLRSDHYWFQTRFANFHWSLGSGLAFNYGKGIFVDGSQSDAQFRLWEIPVDLGVGFEIPLTHWIKIAATGGPSILGLLQNRSDLTEHESGKNKLQVGLGEFVSGQFKINLTGFGGESAYEIFTSNQITNLYFNLEARFHHYSYFLDDIAVTGASFGGGLTFEFL